MEWKTYPTSADPALEALKRLSDQAPQNLLDLKEYLQVDLKFLKMFFWGMEHLVETGNGSLLGSIVSTMRSEFKHAMEVFQAEAEDGGGDTTDWEFMSSPVASLVEKIEELKPQVKQSCSVFLGRDEESASECASYNKDFRFSTYADETVNFVSIILENLDGILSPKRVVDDPVDPAAAVKQQQIRFVQGKLKLFGDFAQLASVWNDPPPAKGENLGKLSLHIRNWANHISCLTCLYWIHFDEMDESQASTLATLLSGLMQKTMPYSPEITSLYLDVLKDANHEKLSLGKHHLALHAACYVDFLLENLDDVEFLREGLIFLLTFVMDPPKVDSEGSEDSGLIHLRWIQLMWVRKTLEPQTDAIISEASSIICSIHSDETREGTPSSKARFLDFLEKIASIKEEVREAYFEITNFSYSNSPRTNAMGFLDFLLRNMKNMLEVKPNFISSVKFRLETLGEELASLGPLLQKILRLQDKDEKIKDLCTRIINAVYYAEYVFNLSSIADVSVWYIIICLSKVIEDVKLLKIEVENIEDSQIYKKEKMTVEIPQATSGRSEGVFVGFHEDAKSIMVHLIGGTKDLTIISISGMPGQGKTTLAKRVYTDSSIQYRFHKTVWCYVSKECEKRVLLLKILRDSSDADYNSIQEPDVEKLADDVFKSLKGKRYLVVLDDIWDVDVWREVQSSFPDDKLGSRILFTSRNHNLASQAKTGSISYPLRLFSDEESWELMKQKLFPSERCPPEVSVIGKEIAADCKGLPLAVALIAAIFGSKEQELDLWKEVAGKLKLGLASERSMQAMELSYQYLPDHMKACFLYFGAFRRGQYIRAKKLKLLWIAEGFIRGDEMRCSQDLAEECLDNLVSQSLVLVTERSSTGWIKTCILHDLLYDLCLEKAAQENFLHWTVRSVMRGSCYSGQNYEQYRVCVDARDRLAMEGPAFISEGLPTGLVRSFLVSGLDPDGRLHVSVLKSLKVVSVLDLAGIMLGLNGKLLKAILGNMVHLRYLAIWFCYCRSIPPSISSLWNLETLIIKTNGPTYHTIYCPEAMLKMKSLRHIEVGRHGAVKFAISSSSELAETCNIETVCSLYDSECQETLRRLPNLRKLRFFLAKKFHRHSSWFSIFKSLDKLESLSIYNIRDRYRRGANDRVLGFNFLPENLKKLTIKYFLPWSAMSTVGQLPNLEVLKLESNVGVGKTWDVEDGEFSKLRFLKVTRTDIEEINVSSCSDPFPSLEELVVEDCGKFEIPSSFGDIYTLKSIKLVRSPETVRSARGIMTQQRDLGNNHLQVLLRDAYWTSNFDSLEIDEDGP